MCEVDVRDSSPDAINYYDKVYKDLASRLSIRSKEKGKASHPLSGCDCDIFWWA